MELNLFYQNREIKTGIPVNAFNLDFLHKLFSPEILSKVITNSNKNLLSQLLPKNDIDLINDPQKLSNLLLNTTTKFNTPINDFYQKYLHNFFSINYQKNIEIINYECFYDFIQKKDIAIFHLKNLLTTIQKNSIMNNNNNQSNLNNNNFQINPNVIINTQINNNNIDNITTTFDMHSELASSGYTSLEIDRESKHSLSRKNSGNINTTQGINNNIDNSKQKDQENNYMNNTSKTGTKNKLINDLNNSYIDPSDENDSFIDRNILKSDRFKNVKKNKIQITIKSRTKEEIENFREQEKERYKYPQKPWEYTLSNGNVAIVAPLFSSQKAMIVKARDHELLKNERPPYITLLALVRDAAARLENGVGTRLDICDLLKDSQYINENISESKINNIVSGALDRLHYQKDPCVKYDSHHKLWIYLHRNRNLDYPGWKKMKNNEEINVVTEINDENKSNKNENNIVIEDLDDDNDESANKKKEKNKEEEIIEVDDNKDSEIFEGKNIVKIHNDSSEISPAPSPSPNLIEFNEKIYSTQKKKIKSSLLGKKRTKK